MNVIKKLTQDNLKYTFNRLLKGPANLTDIASDRIEICPAEKGNVTPSVFLEEELGNILHYHPETTAEIEMHRIRGGEIVHDAAICWEIKDAYISGSTIYKKNYKKVHPQLAHSESAKSTLAEYENDSPLALASSFQGIKYFGHWLRDDVVTYLLAEQYGLPICFPTESWADKTTYAKTFQQHWKRYHQGNIKTLYLFQDYAQNTLRTKRYHLLRSKIRQTYRAKNAGGNVYLKRGMTGNNVRNLINEDELIKTLEKLNFTILDITRDSLQFIIENLIDANLVITIEGSHQNHALYTLAEQGNLLILQPPSMFNNSAKDWCNVLDIKHGLTVCKPVENGFAVNIDSVQKVIGLMSA